LDFDRSDGQAELHFGHGTQRLAPRRGIRPVSSDMTPACIGPGGPIIGFQAAEKK